MGNLGGYVAFGERAAVLPESHVKASSNTWRRGDIGPLARGSPVVWSNQMRIWSLAVVTTDSASSADAAMAVRCPILRLGADPTFPYR